MTALPTAWRSILVKEWVELRRDPQGLLNMAMPLILILVLVLIPVIGGEGARVTLQPLLFWFLVIIIGFYVGILPVGSSMLSLAREGRRMALLRAAPISMQDLLRGKYWAAWTPISLSWLLMLMLWLS